MIEAKVSIIRGRWQAPALRLATRALLVLSLAGATAPPPWGHGATDTAIAVTIATPVLRVLWLIWRWRQEHDVVFVALGITVLAVVGAGALCAAGGIGK